MKFLFTLIRRRNRLRRGRVRDKRYLAWCATQPCCVTGEFPATTHHVRSYGSLKNDRRVIRLVERLHLHGAGMESIERLGKRGLEVWHGVSIEDEIAELRERYLYEVMC